MKIKTNSAICIGFILILMLILAGSKAVINDANREAILANEKINILLEDIKTLKNEIEVLTEINLRDKKHIQRLQEEIEELRIIRARVTAYSPMDNISGICVDEDPTSTATGTVPAIGVAAADPDKLDYGTKLYIPGYGNAVIEDTGAALRRGGGLRLDVVLNSHKEAVEWGVQELDVIIQGRNNDVGKGS